MPDGFAGTAHPPRAPVRRRFQKPYDSGKRNDVAAARARSPGAARRTPTPGARVSGPPSAAQPSWPGVSVVIPVRNEAAALRAALRSIVAQRYPGPMQVIVADGSEDPSSVGKVLEEFPGVRCVRNPWRNAAGGLKLGVEAAAHPIVARCDARCAFPPGYLRRAVRTLARTGAANVGGRQVPVGSTAVERAVAMAMTSLLGSGGARYRRGGPEGNVDTVFLGVFQRNAVLGCGNFDPSLERNQDYELNWRLRRAGGTVWFDPELAVTYRPRRSLSALARQYYDYGRSKRTVLLRAPASTRLRQVLPVLLTAALTGSGLAAVAGLASGWPEIIMAAAALPVAYSSVLLFEAAVSLVRTRDPAAALLAPVLAAMHVGWGMGVLFAPPRRPVRADRQGRATTPSSNRRDRSKPSRSRR